ncbi:MAG: Uma2 family endonuclease, partial [Candidatus Magnetomorum sp.]|nr:Uma2 family endonuclease [Candidatus Magnetomorum sp.]
DLALIHANNPVQMKPHETSYSGCFDICFEFLSDSNKAAIERDTVVKKLEYEQLGIKEYFILDREGKETAFYRLGKNGRYHKIRPTKDNVIRSKVLPQFQFRIDDLYNQPGDEKLLDDPVYRHYYKTELRQRMEQEQIRADEAERRANQEKIKVEQADRRAEKADKRAEQADRRAEQEKMRAEKAFQELIALKKKLNMNTF